jgi:phosphotransferase system  glucose/maltose/N-acetylglucosamine-specific IIC component
VKVITLIMPRLTLVIMAIVALLLVPGIAGWLIEKGKGARQADT